MGECASEWDWMCPNPKEDRTIILVGRTGNGKSATGNSIIEAKVFDEMPSAACVTTSCCRQTAVLDQGQILTVIDTPGSFDVSVEPEIIGLDSGIHAVLLLLSLRNRFSFEESLVIESLKRFFGDKLSDYMIVVFTHGDALEDRPLDDYLGRNCPEQLTRTLEMCGNRYVIFDNVTDDEGKKWLQREELLRLVDKVVAINDGVPYTDELFYEQSEWEWSDQDTEFESFFDFDSSLSKEYEDQLLDMESKHRETTLMSENQSEDADEESVKTKSKDDMVSKVIAYLTRPQREARKKRKNRAIEQQIESRLRETTLRLENKLVDEFDKMRVVDMERAQKYVDDILKDLREDMEENQTKNNRAMERAQKYVDDVFKDLREDMEENQTKNNDAISEITSANERKLRKRILDLERTLAGEKFKSDDDMRKLRDNMEKAQKLTDDALKKLREDMEENQKKNDRAVSELTSANETKLRVRIQELESMLTDEKYARTQAEAKVQEVEKKLKDEISNRTADSVSKKEGITYKTTNSARNVFCPFDDLYFRYC